MQQFRRLVAAAMCLIVGSASFALSYVALRDVAVRVHAVPAYLGFLVPIVIDGGIICGSSVIWALSKEDQRRPAFPFLFVGTLVFVSVVVNISNAGPAIVAKGVASLPPLVLLGTLELVAAQGRRHLPPALAPAPVPEEEGSPEHPGERRRDPVERTPPIPADGSAEPEPFLGSVPGPTPSESITPSPPREVPQAQRRRRTGSTATSTVTSAATRAPSRPAKSSGPPRPIRMPATEA